MNVPNREMMGSSGGVIFGSDGVRSVNKTILVWSGGIKVSDFCFHLATIVVLW